ncbi:protein of unknown function [Pseudomonas sp. JV241A]|nr:protein of unknown function [Pseudomonas sp. JV241A]
MKTGRAGSTEGSLGSPQRLLRALFLLLEGGLLLFLATVASVSLAIPIRDQEQTYFFER